jgi:hypothetical protein
MRSTFNLYEFLKKKELGAILNLGVTLIILINVFQATGCSMALRPATESELEKNKQLWGSKKIANYDFVIIRYEGGQYVWASVLIKVRDGKAVSMEPTETIGQLTKTDYSDFDNFEKVFARIKESYNRGDHVKVSYSSEFGYPEKILIQFKGGGVDSWNSYEISKFEIVSAN